MQQTRLKGGSLSGTYLCEPDGATPFVRKDVSLSHNREYGFQRWYSQLKRIQRYAVMFPGVFPRLLTYGRTEGAAYFDIEYIPDAVTVQEFLTTTTDRAAIDAMLAELVRVMDVMHGAVLPSSARGMDLYLHEEVEQRLAACMTSARFREFYAYDELVFNGERVPALSRVLDEYKALARAAYRRDTETFTHGNLTLENVLYQPATGRIVFIDPYEENVIDSALAEYSQVYQSSHSKYELYNSGTPSIAGNRVDLAIPSYPGLDYFDAQFTAFVADRCTPDDRTAIRMLEVSQFTRMLPFKMETDEDKMLFFYAFASHLFRSVR